jgi:hypothetical protein
MGRKPKEVIETKVKIPTNWSTGSLKIAFGLKDILENYPLLDKWMLVKTEEISTPERERLEVLRLRLLKNFRYWNEETLKMKFISHILELIDYDFDDFQTLFDTEIKGAVDGVDLKAVTDFTIARAIDDVIHTSYFYFHVEPKQNLDKGGGYKRKLNNTDDPIAQVLIPSLIAAELNQDNQPIYGCHVVGEMWYFMLVNGREYAIAKGIDATDKKGLERIFLILKKVRTIIESFSEKS